VKHFKTFIATRAWSASGNDSIDIPRGNYLRRLIVKVYGSFTLAAGSANGTVRTEAPATIFNNIEVVGDDFGKLKTFDGTGLFLSTLYHNRTNFPVLTGDGSAAAQSFLGVFTIDFAVPMKGNIRPADTFLDTRRFSTLRLEWDWSANLRDAMYSGNDRTESVPVAYIMIVGEYETPHADFGDPVVYVQSKIVKSIAAANTAERVELPVGFTYKNVIISAQNKASGEQYIGNDAMIVDYSLEFNANRFHLKAINWVMHQYLDCLDFEADLIHPGANFDLFDLDGMLKESIVTLGGSNLTYVMNVTSPAGTNQIRLYPGVLVKWPVGLRGEICRPAASVPVATQQAKLAKALT
jgi:hypothetical protein